MKNLVQVPEWTQTQTQYGSEFCQSSPSLFEWFSEVLENLLNDDTTIPYCVLQGEWCNYAGMCVWAGWSPIILILRHHASQHGLEPLEAVDIFCIWTIFFSLSLSRERFGNFYLSPRRPHDITVCRVKICSHLAGKSDKSGKICSLIVHRLAPIVRQYEWKVRHKWTQSRFSAP